MLSTLFTAVNTSAAPLVDLTAAAEKSVNAVVYIKVTVQGKTQRYSVQDPFEDFFGGFFGRRAPQQREYREPDKQGAGSGVIISSDGYIVTNNHVVEGATDITVKLNDNREFTGKVIGTDPTTDLALVKVDGKDLPTLPIGDSDQLKIGQWVLAVGNPFNLTSTVTAGIVSAKARSLGANGIESFIQTDEGFDEFPSRSDTDRAHISDRRSPNVARASGISSLVPFADASILATISSSGMWMFGGCFCGRVTRGNRLPA